MRKVSIKLPRPSFAKVANDLELYSSLSLCKRKQNVALIYKTPECWSQAELLIMSVNSPPAVSCNGSSFKLCNCEHAEASAIGRLFVNKHTLNPTVQFSMICTTSPCWSCAQLIVSTRRIREVYFKDVYRVPEPIQWMNKQGVVCDQLL